MPVPAHAASQTRAPRRSPFPASLGVAGATLAVSFSAIFIRLAGSDAATIVWLRMSLAVLLLAPFAARDVRLRRAPRERRDLGLVAAGAVFLAGHFLFWTASLAYTSVAASVLLVSLHPLVVAPLGRRLLGERPGAATYAGMGLAVAGTLITCAGDLRVDARALTGDLLAIAGGLCLAGYLLIGRNLRSSLGAAGYSAAVYAGVAAAAAAVAAAGGTAHLPSLRVAALCLALAAVCTVAGHTVLNWALRHVRAVTVSLAFLGEPPLAALLALAILGAVPPVTTVAGGVLILAGLALALRDPPALPAPLVS
ncbi:MAG: DMT family transporter [Candidatus Dormibacteraeota bacterium]|nr:DMT family transporter [Candidatus Dormibacteraeota bacterium]